MRVLLPIDADEERAIAAVEAVLSLPNAAEAVEVTVLNVEEEVEVKSGTGGSLDSAEWYDEGEYPESVETAVEMLTEAGVSVDRRRMHADPAEAIVEVADEIGAARVVMAGRRRTPVGKVLFGSVVQSVLLSSTVPVTVVSK